MSDYSENNRLMALAADIRAAHTDVSQGAIQLAERALAAGAGLIEARATVPHGEWANWLKAHTGLSARTARRYIQLAKSGIEAATVADLGLRKANEQVSRCAVRRPPAGYFAMAVSYGETIGLVWPDEVHTGYFQVVVLGAIDGQDHSACATVKPCSSEGLPRVIAEAGFPLGTASFKLIRNNRPGALYALRQMALGSGEIAAYWAEAPV